MDKHTSPLAYFGSAVTFMSGFFTNLNWSDIASIAGILFGLATLLINWYYKQKDYELHKLQAEKERLHEENRR